VSEDLRERLLDILADVCMNVHVHDYEALPGGIDLGKHADAILALLPAPEPAKTGECPIALPVMVEEIHEGIISYIVRDGESRLIHCTYDRERAEWLAAAVNSYSPAPTAASEVGPAYTGDGTETLEGWVAPYSEGLWTFEEGEADPHPTSIRASLVLRGIPKFGGHWAEVRVGAPTAAEPEKKALAAIARIIRSVEDRCLAADGPVTPTLAEMTEEELGTIYRLATTQVAAPAEAPTPEKLRAMAEWFNSPANPMVVEVETTSSVTAGYMLRRIADALALCALATPEAEGGSR